MARSLEPANILGSYLTLAQDNYIHEVETCGPASVVLAASADTRAACAMKLLLVVEHAELGMALAMSEVSTTDLLAQREVKRRPEFNRLGMFVFSCRGLTCGLLGQPLPLTAVEVTQLIQSEMAGTWAGAALGPLLDALARCKAEAPLPRSARRVLKRLRRTLPDLVRHRENVESGRQEIDRLLT